ncbi:cellulose synthase/poly-beta-1,6-N-acetylglucosamine synthase-like glycosyltransferase [Nonlabens xylanidelens]|uniref:Cellulose synthase/poly-beta-1,6-N-acetylglucosamine synthase-like glycosyltransferase n=1 Tax=Nonlabens xylanidelens TaxID=191564 RepID=A0A2S6ISE0_9FLAO|nr:cellulose synthase family protein [Nonlabens xylanidelens]PPK97070.1 cellulose synthase/poly-beta-1,6-N-acetylglucosamine synthase-like glycosyltransferase [Nonlabens xylanidelens]PQJ13755.1 glycosyl transferase family 2 [Nonlabens xylanidelens]
MILEWICIVVYSISLILILFYAFAQLNLLINYVRAQKIVDNSPLLDLKNPEEVPYVTIQLPVFNEAYVMDRLLDNIALIEYPREKLEIQVLDDSTDETVETTAAHVNRLAATGLDIVHITRTDRSGFKAGALKEGLAIAKGDLIAIFDADFLPDADWLYKTIPYFKDPEIGVVQTRWAHLNRNYSILTQIQAFALDAHFTLEQVGRNSKGHFINFNGTAGVWRKETIYDAGNWEGDTLTEDLDLSYRAQLKNWKFKYLEHVTTPAELPIVISAARSQQFRWNKGGAENFRKMFKRVVSSEMSFKSKMHGVLHLLNSTMFLNVLIVGILSIPMLYIKNEYGHLREYFIVMSFFVISTIIFFICYWYMYKKTYGSGLKNFISYIGMFFTFFSIAMGFSFHNSIAVLEGHAGKRSEFVRTPKFNLKAMGGNWKSNKYLRKKISPHVIIEGILMLYFAFGMYSAFVVGTEPDFGLFPFHLMLTVGFGFVFFRSLTDKQ